MIFSLFKYFIKKKRNELRNLPENVYSKRVGEAQE